MDITPASLIRDLVAAGLSENEIARRLQARGVHVSQSTITRIKNAVIARTRYDIGAALQELHAECVQKSARQRRRA